MNSSIPIVYAETRRHEKLSDAVAVPADIKDSSLDYGCEVNNVAPDALLEFLQKAGFLYPAKYRKLAPFIDIAKENWRRAAELGNDTLVTLNTGFDTNEEPATVSGWRTTFTGWQFQHLASMGNAARTRAVILAAQAFGIHNAMCGSYQNWFRPENRFPARIFGATTTNLGPSLSTVSALNLVDLRLPFTSRQTSVEVTSTNQNGNCSGLYELAKRARGKVYAEAEELDHDDIELDRLDQIYTRVGLRRYRRIWLAWNSGSETPVGAALVYRGPLGLNLSFLENRCDLLLAPSLKDQELLEIIVPLLSHAAANYEDFPPAFIPVVAETRALQSLRAIGGEITRRYCQSVWLREGFVSWYRQVEGFYQRVAIAQRHHGLARRLTNSHRSPMVQTH